MTDQLDKRKIELRQLDELTGMDSSIRRLHPLSKFLVTIGYIYITVSVQKYNLSGLIPMVLYPVVMFQLGGIDIRTCFVKMRALLPFLCFVGLFNPFFDRVPVLQLGGIIITGGMISMLTLCLKGIFCMMASFILVATTPMDEICRALRMLHVPALLVELLLLTYRYISVLMDEFSVMVLAYKLRAPGQNGIAFRAWGSFLGQLLLRSMDRAQEIYSEMLLRGFDGEFRHASILKIKAKDCLFVFFVLGICIVLRYINLSVLLGSMFV